mgnify:CR=1 FL=1
MISLRDIIILLCIAVVSVIGAITIDSGSQSQNQQDIVGLFDDAILSFDSVNRISLTRSDETFVFEQTDGAWLQTLPFEMSMDPSSMQSIIQAAQGVRVLGQVEHANLQPLDIGNHNLIIFSDGTNEVEVQLGRKTLGGRAYASVGGKPPVVIDHSLHRIALDMDHKLWRDVRVFPNFAIDGTQIERSVEGDRMLLIREGGRWHMREPVASRVDQTVLTEWVGQIASSRVGSFISDSPNDLSLFGLQYPSASFKVKDSGGQVWNLLIGSRISAGSQDRFVMIEQQPIVFAMNWNAIEQLFPRAEQLVDSTGSDASKYDVKRLTVRGNGLEIQFEKKLDQWIQLSEGAPIPTKTVDALIQWVLESKPISIAFGPYPRLQEIMTVTMDGYDLMPMDTVRIAKTEDGQFILENGDNVLRYHVPESGTFLNNFLK